ncbi:MAG TPA: hypothetical protein VL122_02555 [Nitrospirota bacterium]|nr:hypothetical protein [Nitrospirota bacterium]
MMKAFLTASSRTARRPLPAREHIALGNEFPNRRFFGIGEQHTVLNTLFNDRSDDLAAGSELLDQGRV